MCSEQVLVELLKWTWKGLCCLLVLSLSKIQGWDFFGRTMLQLTDDRNPSTQSNWIQWCNLPVQWLKASYSSLLWWHWQEKCLFRLLQLLAVLSNQGWTETWITGNFAGCVLGIRSCIPLRKCQLSLRSSGILPRVFLHVGSWREPQAHPIQQLETSLPSPAPPSCFIHPVFCKLIAGFCCSWE